MPPKDFSPQLEALFGPLLRKFTAYRFSWTLVIVCFLIAWNRGIALLYAVAALGVAALLLSHLLAWLNLRGVRVRREPVPAVAAGETPVLHYRLNAPGARHFLLLEEPGLGGLTPTLVTQLAGAASVERELHELHRGVYRLGALRLRTAYPFGLLTRETELRQAAQELVVFPRWHELASLPAPRARRARQSVSELVSSRHRGLDEFAGVRELRPGEGIKHVHWRASARQERLLVKEYDAQDTPSLLIVLPQQPGFECGAPPASCFEYAIELAVSLARTATRAGYPVHLVSEGTRARHRVVAPYTAELSATLDWFARLQPEAATPLALAVERGLARVSNCGWLASFRHAGERLQVPDAGGCHLDFVFDRKSFRGGGGAPGGPARERFARGLRYRVARETSLAGLLAC